MNMIPLWLGSPKKPTAGRPAREPRSQGSPAPFDYLGGLPVCIWEFCETSSYFCSYSSMARSPVHSVRSLQVVMPLLLVAICSYLLEKNILEKKNIQKTSSQRAFRRSFRWLEKQRAFRGVLSGLGCCTPKKSRRQLAGGGIASQDQQTWVGSSEVGCVLSLWVIKKNQLLF